MSPKSGTVPDQHADAEVCRHAREGHVGHAANPRRKRNDRARPSPPVHRQCREPIRRCRRGQNECGFRERETPRRAESRCARGSGRGRSRRRDSSGARPRGRRAQRSLRKLHPVRATAVVLLSRRGCFACSDATIDRVDGGCSSAAERLTVAQDVVGSIPTSRPNRIATFPAATSLPALNSRIEATQKFLFQKAFCPALKLRR